MAPANPRRSQPVQAPTRPSRTRAKAVTSYAEEDSEESEDELVGSPPAPTRRTRQSTTYSSHSDHATSPQPTTRVRRNPSRSKPAQVQSRKRTRPLAKVAQRRNRREHILGRKKRRVDDSSSKQDVKQQPYIIPSDFIPKWLELPYGVWIQIFKFVTYPLYDQHTFQPTPSSKWLLDVALVCRHFTEPALTVLLATPPLVPMAQAHSLVNLLKADPRSLKYKYRSKVETLQIEVYQVAKYSLNGSGVLDLYGLIKDLPRLKHLEFYHKKDMSPYRELDDNINWTYPETIFDALEHVDPKADDKFGDKTSVCRLQSWRWSSRMAGTTYPVERIPKIHLLPSFASLQKVAFVNYQVRILKKDEEDPKHEQVIAAALENLKRLRHLVFESSTLMNHKLLPLLPRNLRNMELINCWEIVAEDFGPFLITHGSQLHCLTLNHNQSLSLSFLPVLGLATPKLQVLRMNFTYYNIHATYRDSEPQYEHLMTADEIPSWPSTLQIIEITQMRKWQTDAAETFFQSLLDSAGHLRDLRRLSLQAILNIGWRDRASFRDEWVGSLTRVFKNISSSPSINTTIRKMAGVSSRHAKENLGDRTIKTDATSAEQPQSLPIRKSRRADASTSDESEASEKGSTEQSESSAKRRTIRSSTRQHTRGKYAESDSEPDSEPEEKDLKKEKSLRPKDPRRSGPSRELQSLQPSVGYHGNLTEEDSSPASASDSGTASSRRRSKIKKGKENEIIQGMCDIVEIRIDNLRPTETQVTERDFLDEEPSGDEDWNEDNDVDDRYAW